MADSDTALSKEIFYISVTQIESVVKPDSVGDDSGRESMSFVRIHRQVISFRRVNLAIPSIYVCRYSLADSSNFGPLNCQYRR